MPNNTLRNLILKKFMEFSIKSCHLLVVDSYFAKEEIVKLLHLYKKKIEVVYLGINNTFFSKEREKKLIQGFDYSDKYILSVLSCARHHNIINLLKAYKILIKELDFDLKIVFVFQILDKNYFSEINKYIKANFNTNKVFIFPNLDSNLLPDLYKNSELYVFTSYCEVFGLTSLEAMSQEIPVVISNRSALPEINGDAAVYFDPDDISEIKGSLKKVLIDKQLKQKLINNGNRQLKKFNNKENIKKTIKIIENTI
tara:strand:- start:196 stop:960 length:765 start_codon:yes stop_codon:yes gene_type:complete